MGKTVLSKSVSDAEYFDCELPRVRRMLEDPEAFLEEKDGSRIILDEIHRLEDPSQFLKIAADHFQKTKILATGSSSLGATSRFRDTLSGRKIELWLTPIILADMNDFDRTDLKARLLHGGLPPFFLETDISESDYQDWMDSYWAKDILELFRLERRASLQKLAELLILQSGRIFEATQFAKICEASRTTITNYLTVMEATFVMHLLRPFSTHRSTEIVAAPKVYAFDTGFVCYHRGISRLRTDDYGLLWEHFVLNELHAQLQTRKIHYWRDKRGHEVDFVWLPRGKDPIAIEAKWTDHEFEPNGIRAFRRQYAKGDNFAVVNNIGRSYQKKFGDILVRFVGLPQLIQILTS